MECIPCFFKQALTAAQIARLDEAKIKKVFDRIAASIPEISLETSPPEIGMMIYKIIYHTADTDDPFNEIKKTTTDLLLKRYADMKKMIHAARDPIYTALRFAAIGNVIDLGANPDCDVEDELARLHDSDFDVCDYQEFRNSMKGTRNILYIADNAGETVMDRLLIEQMGKATIYAVRSRPIINDATCDDARQAGIDQVADIMSSGSDAPGTVWSLCTEEFKRKFAEADMVISKGQGNYETLSDQERSMYFLLKVKCPVIARDIHIRTGSLVLKKK
ncbi:MAG: DUF89 family protein [candidate division WOR-3 bacterium]|nr:MAG: DUF89 family protein [candidate division WOR-3 bacterium]